MCLIVRRRMRLKHERCWRQHSVATGGHFLLSLYLISQPKTSTHQTLIFVSPPPTSSVPLLCKPRPLSMPNWTHTSAVPCRRPHSESPSFSAEASTAALLSGYSTPLVIPAPLSISKYGSKYVFHFSLPLNVNSKIKFEIVSLVILCRKILRTSGRNALGKMIWSMLKTFAIRLKYH